MSMATQHEDSDMLRKIRFIDSLYLYSDLSVEHIAEAVKIDVTQAQKIIESLIRKDATEAIYEQANTTIGQIMRRDVETLDISKSALDAAILMIRKGIGCVVVTAKGRPYGMVTERDILCEMTVFDKRLSDLSLEIIASRPLICTSPLETIENVANLMMENNVRRVPVIQDDNLAGIVVAKDLAMLLSSTKRPGLAKAVLEAMSRSRTE